MSIYSTFLTKKQKVAGLLFAILGTFFFIAATSKKPSLTVVPVSQSAYKTIIFDLGDVLFTTNSFAKNKLIATTLIQNPTLLYYLINFDTKHEYFQFLHSVPAINHNKIFHNGKPMPAIMADWQIGITQGNEIIKKINDALLTTKHPSSIKNLFAAITTFMFTPETLAASQQPIDSMIRMAQALKKAGYKLFALSNWDEQSFALVKNNHPEIFQLFDGIVISGQEKIAKPNQEFFKLLLQKYNINPTTAIFIDDEASNITTAQSLGITSILCDKPSSVIKDLINFGVVTLTS